MRAIASTAAGIQVSKDGVLDYPLYPGQVLKGTVWQVQGPAEGVGPSVAAGENMLQYRVDQQTGYNQTVFVSTTTPATTALGAVLLFRIRANTITGDEMKLSLPGSVILRSTSDGPAIGSGGTVLTFRSWRRA